MSYFADLIQISPNILVLRFVIWTGERLVRAAGYMDRLMLPERAAFVKLQTV